MASSRRRDDRRLVEQRQLNGDPRQLFEADLHLLRQALEPPAVPDAGQGEQGAVGAIGAKEQENAAVNNQEADLREHLMRQVPPAPTQIVIDL